MAVKREEIYSMEHARVPRPLRVSRAIFLEKRDETWPDRYAKRVAFFSSPSRDTRHVNSVSILSLYS